jgi:hypothetical protein
VNADGVRDFGCGNDGRHVEVTVDRRRRSDANRLVGEQYVLEVVVRRGMHGDGLDAHLATGTLHAQGDLATIGYYDFV